jgi:3-oxoacyl-[acyl-carrier protein] reductase
VKESRVMVLTGCASGIGRQLATDLYRLGHRIVATDVNDEGMREWGKTHWPDPDRVEVAKLDVREAESWEHVLDRAGERFGRVDALINVAGLLVARWAHEMSLAEVGLTIDVNVKGVMFGTNAAARRMIAQGGGHIVNVASIAGLTPVPGLAVYSASKHAVRGFSLSVAEELKRHGVFVTVVCPGPVDTPMLDQQLPFDEAALTFSGPRALTAEEVASAIIGRALVHRPMELVVTVPGSGQRQMAKLAGALPELATWLRPVLERKGKRQQKALRRRREP